EIGRWLRPGRNELRIRVTNRLINRIAAMTSMPPIAADVAAHYGPARPLAPRVPENFDDITYVRDWAIGGVYLAQKERGFRPLPDAGLLGPVRLVPVRLVRIAPGAGAAAGSAVPTADP